MRWFWGSLLVVVAVGGGLGSEQPTAAEKEQTHVWIQACRRPDGGFAENHDPKTPSSLRATLAGIRALKYFGGELSEKAACVQFVQRCYNRKETGFAPRPGEKVDVLSTALGLMAVVELDIQDAEYRVPPAVYLCANAKKFEEVRLAAAAYEALRTKCELAADWIADIERKRHPDGTYGNGPTAAYHTASAVVTLLRLGKHVEHPDAVLRVLRAGQRPDGGWGLLPDNRSDLESTYRVLRAFAMLKASPQEPAACRQFVARCRCADGSYALRPGQNGSLTATYFAAAVLRWLSAEK